ncbi:MAG: prepilin peptidase [Pseudomonadota bacterium]|uniref:A24 family peptidase n=1 Tax=Vibrio campbellii TaxID=680 RepID=UPI001D179031|nr:prepilin peptidase [Vibrio campbellii]MCC4223414.1 prepilin peptidase [Vibrio campbellii]
MLFVYITLAIVCFVVSLSDIRERTIKNSHVLVIAVLAIAIGIADFSLSSLWVIGICWSALLFLHVLGVLGGGDVKLIAAFSLSLPTQSLLEALIFVGIYGGILAVIYLILLRPSHVTGEGDILQFGLPYGVAICCGFYTALLLKTSV